jgi:ABC-2 type transport system ATP-binding protein
VTSLSADLITRWPDVQAVTLDRGRIQITATNADTVVKKLAVADADFRDLEVHRAGLAEAFTELTQEATS